MPYCDNNQIFCSICCLYQRSTRTYYCGYEHNCPKPQNESSNPVGAIVGGSAGGAALLICVIIIYCVCKYRRSDTSRQVTSTNNNMNTQENFNTKGEKNGSNNISTIQYNPTQPDFAVPNLIQKHYDPTNPAQANIQQAYPQSLYFQPYQQPPPYNLQSAFFNK